MAVAFELYTTGDTGNDDMWANDWRAQTFTPETSEAYTITSVKLLMYRIGSPGTVTVSIKATSSSKPSGADLCSGTTSAGTLTTDTAGEWREITFGTNVPLSNGTLYAIVVRLAGGDIDNRLVLRLESPNGGYVRGTRCWSNNGGSGWNIDANDADILFEAWGNVSITTEAVTSIKSYTATGNGTIIDVGGEDITQHGHCWDTSIYPTTSDSKTENGAGALEAFTSSITGLSRGTSYHVRAYATTAYGTSYGDGVTFTTLSYYIYPSDTITRVTSLTHRYSEGAYTLELHLGEVISDFGLPEWDSKAKTAVPEDEEYVVLPGAKEAIEKALAETTWGATIEAKKLAYEAKKRATQAKTELEQEITKFKRLIPKPTPTAPVSRDVVTDPGLRKYLPKAEPAPTPTGEPWWQKYVGGKERIGE